MKIGLLPFATVAALAAFGSLLSASSASAATCTATVTASVSLNSGCEIGSTTNDALNVGAPLPPNTLRVNVDNIFGDGWSFISRDNDLDGTERGDAAALTITGDQLSGSFLVDLTGTLFDEALLVFKGGAGANTEPQNYVAYLLSSALIGIDGILAGIYSSPFLDTTDLSSRNISQVSLYGRIDAVPLPAALPLLLSALGGLGFMGWRRGASGTA